MRGLLVLLAAGTLLLCAACAGTAKPESAVEEVPRARQHVYFVEHRLLPALLFDDPERMRDSLEDFGQSFITRTWNQAAEEFPEEERVPPEGLKVEGFTPSPDLEVFIVTFPTPLSAPENYYSAFSFQGETSRYFTLEMTLFGEGALGVLGEWTPSGHANYGPVPITDGAGFLREVVQLLGEADRQPVAGISMGQEPDPPQE